MLCGAKFWFLPETGALPVGTNVYMVIFVNFARQTSQNFPLQFMSIYSNENIRKIAKLSPREFPHLVQNCENICTRKLWRIQYCKNGQPCRFHPSVDGWPAWMRRWRLTSTTGHSTERATSTGGSASPLSTSLQNRSSVSERRFVARCTISHREAM